MAKKHKNRGHMYDRVKHNPREAAFARHWEKENLRNPGTNYGRGILQDLFGEEHPMFGHRAPHFKHIVTDSERFVAATVVQWLGSNCGMSFLREALAKCGYTIVKIEKKRK